MTPRFLAPREEFIGLLGARQDLLFAQTRPPATIITIFIRNVFQLRIVEPSKSEEGNMSDTSPMIEDLQERLQAEFEVNLQPLPATLQHALNNLAAAEKTAAAGDRAA